MFVAQRKQIWRVCFLMKKWVAAAPDPFSAGMSSRELKAKKKIFEKKKKIGATKKSLLNITATFNLERRQKEKMSFQI